MIWLRLWVWGWSFWVTPRGHRRAPFSFSGGRDSPALFRLKWKCIIHKNIYALFLITEYLHVVKLKGLWWYTYSLEVNQEAEEGGNNTIFESDHLSCPVKVILLKMLTANDRWFSCSESFPPQSQFPLLPLVFVFGKPSRWKEEIGESQQKNNLKRSSSLFLPSNVLEPFFNKTILTHICW